MKIAFVCQPWDEITPSSLSGSIPIIVYQLAHRLAETNRIVIYAKKGDGQAASEIDGAGIEYRRFSTKLEDWLLKPPKLIERSLGYPLRFKPLFAREIYYRRFALQVANDMRRGDFDIVHVINFSQFLPLIKAGNPNVRTILHMECEWLTQIDHTLIENRLQSIDMVVGCSDFITDRVRQRYPEFDSRCVTLFNGVNPEQYNASEDAGVEENSPGRTLEPQERLLYVGRISPEKGIHVLLDAFVKVARKRPNVRLDIVGPAGSAPYEFTILPSDDDKTADLASFYPHSLIGRNDTYFSILNSQIPDALRERITFHGVIPQSTISGFYQAADLFVFPSVWHEPFGIPLIEAMACEVPVVATRSGGMTEIVQDGITGKLVERGDATELAEAIIDLLNDANKRRSMGELGRDRVLQVFSWDHIAAELQNRYEELLAADDAYDQSDLSK